MRRLQLELSSRGVVFWATVTVGLAAFQPEIIGVCIIILRPSFEEGRNPLQDHFKNGGIGMRKDISRLLKVFLPI